MSRRSISTSKLTSLKRVGVGECLGVDGNELDRVERGTAIYVPISRGAQQRLTPLQTRRRKRHTPSVGAREGIPVIRQRVFLRLEERAHPNGHHCVQFCCSCEHWIDEKKEVLTPTLITFQRTNVSAKRAMTHVPISRGARQRLTPLRNTLP